MDLFNRQWSTYRQIVDHNLMEHRALSAELAKALNSYLQQRQVKAEAGGNNGNPNLAMVDLGCGDLAPWPPSCAPAKRQSCPAIPPRSDQSPPGWW